jgi:hypothetical protein
MAEAFVNVTEGSGKKLHAWDRTIGANTTLDEYVLLGENGLPSYTVSTSSTSTATAASHVLQIMAGATNKVRIRRIEIHQQVMATTVLNLQWQILRLGTAGTGGTAITPMALDSADAAAGCTAMTLPTVKGTETGANAIVNGTLYMMQTLAVSALTLNPGLVWDFDRPRSKPIIIPAGTTNGICIKNISAVAAGTVNINVWLDESSFL